jgi:EAL domain-containing protein (putative c-di-GMP-specific phosphodiesterase class I)
MGLLERFAIDILKIDRSLIDQTPKNKKAAAITTAIINLAHSLELRVIAEGVEKEEQLAFLHQQQCDAVQGFWFSPPLSASDFTGLLAARQGK